MTAALFYSTAPGGTGAPPRCVPRNSAEQVGANLFPARDVASCIPGVTLPVGGGDLA